MLTKCPSCTKEETFLAGIWGKSDHGYVALRYCSNCGNIIQDWRDALNSGWYIGGHANTPLKIDAEGSSNEERMYRWFLREWWDRYDVTRFGPSYFTAG